MASNGKTPTLTSTQRARGTCSNFLEEKTSLNLRVQGYLDEPRLEL